MYLLYVQCTVQHSIHCIVCTNVMYNTVYTVLYVQISCTTQYILYCMYRSHVQHIIHCTACTNLMYNTVHTVQYVQIPPSHSPVRSRSRNGTRHCIRLRRETEVKIVKSTTYIWYVRKYGTYSIRICMHSTHS